MSTIIKLLDIQFDLEAINQSLVSRRSGFSTSYTNELILGIKDNLESRKIVRDTIIAIYGDAIKRVPSMGKNTNKKNKTLLNN